VKEEVLSGTLKERLDTSPDFLRHCLHHLDVTSLAKDPDFVEAFCSFLKVQKFHRSPFPAVYEKPGKTLFFFEDQNMDQPDKSCNSEERSNLKPPARMHSLLEGTLKIFKKSTSLLVYLRFFHVRFYQRN
jgi:hypothetical protein